MRLEELSEHHAESFVTLINQLCKGASSASSAKDAQAFLADLPPPDTVAVFKKSFLKVVENERMDWRPKAGKTSLSRYLMLDEKNRICALALMRFPLDEKTEDTQGNLWVSVPESLRDHGYGSYALALLLFEAVRAGLRRVLVIAQANDGAGNKIILKNRGELHDRQDFNGHACNRYWISFS